MDILFRTTYKNVGRTSYKEVAQAPPLPYATVDIGTYTQSSCIQSEPSLVLVRVQFNNIPKKPKKVAYSYQTPSRDHA
jgi:hypothetical protein